MSSTRRWILVPGTLCTGAVFDPVLDRLGVARPARVTVDLASPDLDVCAQRIVDAAGPDDIICGFSLGAIVAAHMADRLSSQQHLVLFAVNPLSDDPEKRPGRMAMLDGVQAHGGSATLRANPPALEGAQQALVLDTIVAMAGVAQVHIGAHTQLALSRPGALEALSRASVPVLVIHGDRDVQTPPAMARMVEDAAPNGQAVILPGLGHYALLEDPDAAADAVRTGLSLREPG